MSEQSTIPEQPAIPTEAEWKEFQRRKRSMSEDNWQHRSTRMKCHSCMWWVAKTDIKTQVVSGSTLDPRAYAPVNPLITVMVLGRCRRNAPTMSGWPAVFSEDWCGNHKLDETKI